MGAGQQREIQEAKWSGGQIHLRQSLNEEANADEFSECQQVSCPPAERRMNPFPYAPPSPSAYAKIPPPIFYSLLNNENFTQILQNPNKRFYIPPLQ